MGNFFSSRVSISF